MGTILTGETLRVVATTPDQDRDEYRSAANRSPVWREPQRPTRDDLRDMADEWGDE